MASSNWCVDPPKSTSSTSRPYLSKIPRSTAIGTADVQSAFWFQVNLIFVRLPVALMIAGAASLRDGRGQCRWLGDMGAVYRLGQGRRWSARDRQWPRPDERPELHRRLGRGDQPASRVTGRFSSSPPPGAGLGPGQPCGSGKDLGPADWYFLPGWEGRGRHRADRTVAIDDDVIAAQQRVADFFHTADVIPKTQVVVSYFERSFNTAVFAS